MNSKERVLKVTVSDVLMRKRGSASETNETGLTTGVEREEIERGTVRELGSDSDGC